VTNLYELLIRDRFIWIDAPATFVTRVYHNASICVTWLIHMWDMTHWYVWHDSFICVTWLIHMWNMTHSYVWHDSFMCDMTHPCACHHSSICVTWLVQTCDMTHSYAWHDSFICVTWLIHICHSSYIRDTECVGTGWQGPIACLELQVVFRKRATNYRTLLRKMTYEEKAFYGSSPPCSLMATYELQ